ncbi:MAG TPA: DUF4271 domain-containing protein [Chitinophagaceae bacterium]|nr:DUF4271 domain-containing protein [Chitinophagaceae bacterium]
MNRILLTLFCCLSLNLVLAQDTVLHQRDSVITPPPPRDTVRKAVDTVRAVIDSTPAVPSPPQKDIISALRKLLSEHPYFSFFGKAVTMPAIPRETHGKDVSFYVLLGLFFYFALIKTVFSKYLNNLVSIFLRITLRQQQLREQLLQSPLPSLLMNIFFLLTGGLYASLLLDYYKYQADPNFWIQTLYCTGILAVIYLGKYVLLKFTGWVFNLSKATDTYIFIVFLVNKMLGLLLLPFLVLIAFYSGQAQQVFVTLSLILVVVLFVYRFIFSFGPIRAEIKVNPFHFFLYLCAFEIAPLLLIYKVLLAILGTSN